MGVSGDSKAIATALGSSWATRECRYTLSGSRPGGRTVMIGGHPPVWAGGRMQEGCAAGPVDIVNGASNPMA